MKMLQIIFIWFELLMQIYAKPGTETHQGIPAYFLMEDHSPSLHVKVDLKGSKVVANPAGMFVTTESRIFQEHHLHGSGTSRSGVAHKKTKALRPRNGTDNAVTRSIPNPPKNITRNITSIFKTKLSEKSHRHTLSRKTALNHRRKSLIKAALDELKYANDTVQKTSVFKTKLSEKSHRHTLGRKTALNHRRKTAMSRAALENSINSRGKMTLVEQGSFRNKRTVFEGGSNVATNSNHEYKYNEANLGTLLNHLPEQNTEHVQQVRSNLNEYDNTVNNVETPIHDASRSQLMLLPHHNEYAPATPVYAPMQRKSAAPSAHLFNITKVKVNTPSGVSISNKTLADAEPIDLERLAGGAAMNDDDRMMQLEENQSLLDPKTSIKSDSITSTWSNSVIDDSAKQRNTHPESINTEDELINVKFFGNTTSNDKKDGALKNDKDSTKKDVNDIPLKSESSAITKLKEIKDKLEGTGNIKNDSTSNDDSLMKLAAGTKIFDANNKGTDNLFDMFKVSNNSVPKLLDHEVINTNDASLNDISKKKNSTAKDVDDISIQNNTAVLDTSPDKPEQKSKTKTPAGNIDKGSVTFSGNNGSVSAYTSEFKEEKNGEVERVKEVINFNIDVNLPKEKTVKMTTGVSTDGGLPQARNVTQNAEVSADKPSEKLADNAEKNNKSVEKSAVNESSAASSSETVKAASSEDADNKTIGNDAKLTTSEKITDVKNESSADLKKESEKAKTNESTETPSTASATVQSNETLQETKPVGENASSVNADNETSSVANAKNETVNESKPATVVQEPAKNNDSLKTTDSKLPTTDLKETINNPNATAVVNNQTTTPSNATLMIRERKFNATKAVIADVLDAVKEELFLRLHTTGTLKSKNHTLERVASTNENQAAPAIESKTGTVENKLATDSSQKGNESSAQSPTNSTNDKLNAEIFIRSNETFNINNATSSLANSSDIKNTTEDLHNQTVSAPLNTTSSTHENATARENDKTSGNEPVKESDQVLWNNELRNGGEESKDVNPKPVKINTDPAADNFYGHENLMEPINDGGYTPEDYSNAQLDYHTDPVYYHIDTGGGLAYNHMDIPPHYRRG